MIMLQACNVITPFSSPASTSTRIKKIWYIYEMEYYLVIRKDKAMKFADI